MVTTPNVKVNLGLNVLRKRDDGFHDLETLFVPYFEITDTLEIIRGDDYSRLLVSLTDKYGNKTAPGGVPQLVQDISSDGKVMITIARREGVDWEPLSDLTVRAYQILAKDFELPPVKIFLEKTSPVGAGLGGGSADAAFALKMLGEMFSLGLDETSLVGYASRLGSDCAFFIYNRPMFGSGRGEILEDYPLEGISHGNSSEGEYVLKVVVPEGETVSTAQAYRGICPCIPATALRDVLSSPVETWKDALVNDFEATVFASHPALKMIKDSLYESGAVYASMSGSGSALYGIYHK